MNALRTAIQRSFRQPTFVVAVVLLGLCALVLNSAASYLELHFKKRPAPLRVSSLADGIPENLGHWVAVSHDQSIDRETEQVLATSSYLFRDYVDSRKIDKADIERMRSASPAERDKLLTEFQMLRPSTVIRAAVTYYTGLVDTVAHVPERCYIADGFEVVEWKDRETTIGTHADGSPRSLTYRFVGFEDQTGAGNTTQRVSRNVGYVFHCNGQYECGAEAVRYRLQNLMEPYAYYAKVELMTATPLPMGYQRGPIEVNNKDESAAAMEDFLSEALPHVERCLPDWKALHAKKPGPTTH